MLQNVLYFEGKLLSFTLLLLYFFFSVPVAAYSSREAEYKNEEMSSLVTVNIIPSRPIIR